MQNQQTTKLAGILPLPQSLNLKKEQTEFSVRAWFFELLKQIAADGWAVSENLENETAILEEITKDSTFDRVKAITAESYITGWKWSKQIKENGLQAAFFNHTDKVFLHAAQWRAMMQDAQERAFQSGKQAQKEATSNDAYQILHRDFVAMSKELAQTKLQLVDEKKFSEKLSKIVNQLDNQCERLTVKIKEYLEKKK